MRAGVPVAIASTMQSKALGKMAMVVGHPASSLVVPQSLPPSGIGGGDAVDADPEAEAVDAVEAAPCPPSEVHDSNTRTSAPVSAPAIRGLRSIAGNVSVIAERRRAAPCDSFRNSMTAPTVKTIVRRRSLAAVLAFVLTATACGGGGHNGTVTTELGEAKSSVQRISATVDDAAAASRSVDGFALDLLRANLGTTKGNVALSPWSIVTALAMTRAGARGTTADEMDRVLHITDPASIHRAMNGLDQQLRSRNGTFPGNDEQLTVELSAANRVFAQQGLHLDSTFLDTLAGNYGAAVGLADYKKAAAAARTAINQWVAGQTRDRITDLIPDGALNELTRLVLVNAIYLRADWAIPFDKRQTYDGTFQSPAADVTVPLMRGSELRGWAQGDGWNAVELDYAGNQLAMTVLVPDAGRFDEITSHLDATMLDAIASSHPAEVDLTLPKFDIETKLSLKEQLSALGMPTAFIDSKADFSGITTDEPLVIDDVIHEANVTVDEKGTVAAAATAVIMRASSAPSQVQHLTVDRPFVYLLRDKTTGAIVFAGQVTNPSTKT